jgi:hypothetical protein
MDTAAIVREINAEIAKLTSARDILSRSNSNMHARQRTLSKGVVSARPGNRLSPAGRRKLSALMKKRWAERRKKAAAKAK